MQKGHRRPERHEKQELQGAGASAPSHRGTQLTAKANLTKQNDLFNPIGLMITCRCLSESFVRSKKTTFQHGIPDVPQKASHLAGTQKPSGKLVI
jgi:hypothetical protein